MTNLNPEPETRRCAGLYTRIQPAWVVIPIHWPVVKIPDTAELGEWLAQAFELPLVTSVGYETPGSFGRIGVQISTCIASPQSFRPSPPTSQRKYLCDSGLLLAS